MKDNIARLMLISCIACFLVGGLVGYMARSKIKMTPKQFEDQLSRLDSRETAELVAVLQRAWGISAESPTTITTEKEDE